MALGVWAVLAWPHVGVAQIRLEESAEKFRPAEDLEATHWATEPMVHNPTNIDSDDP